LLVASVPDRMARVFGGTQRPECVSILTPLAPGSDTVLTELALAWLADKKIVHRLILVRSLPRKAVTTLYHASTSPEMRWSLHQPSDKGGPDDSMSRLTMVERASGARTEDVLRLPTLLVDLQPPGRSLGDWLTSTELQRDAFQRANAYMAQRADVILAYVDSSRVTHRAGGAAEALAWSRDHGQIPAPLRENGSWRRGRLPEVLVVGEESGVQGAS
jgi:hypothetical protein